jgi:hypothetical protein
MEIGQSELSEGSGSVLWMPNRQELEKKCQRNGIGDMEREQRILGRRGGKERWAS